MLLKVNYKIINKKTAELYRNDQALIQMFDWAVADPEGVQGVRSTPLSAPRF